MAVTDFLTKIIDFTNSTIIQQNIVKLYTLLYPLIAEDFRHKTDCLTAMNIVDTHTHPYVDTIIVAPTPKVTSPPVVPSAVQDAFGLALIGVDAQTGLPAKISAATVIKPFTVT